MAESTRADELEQSPEPDQYFKGKQWYSAKRGEWIGRNIYSVKLIVNKLKD